MTRIICILIFLIAGIEGATIYIVPFRGCDVRQLFFEPSPLRDEIAKPFIFLRVSLEQMGYQVKFTETCEGLEDISAILSFESHNELLTNISQYPKEKCFLFNFEPPVVLPESYAKKLQSYFGKIFVLFDDFEDPCYRKFYYPQPRLEMLENEINFSNRKLCVMIAGNKDSTHPQSLYNERRRAIFFFESLYRINNVDDFVLYGFGWDGWLLYKGSIPNKWEVYKKYKFSICYENMGNQRGYITEKIFDSFVGGCVPIYLGAENIAQVIPKECFIDRREFRSDEELYTFIKTMDVYTHEKYLNAIKRYLQSSESKLFSVDHFVEMIKYELSKTDHKKNLLQMNK